jgi:hypothetical protein
VRHVAQSLKNKPITVTLEKLLQTKKYRKHFKLIYDYSIQMYRIYYQGKEIAILCSSDLVTTLWGDTYDRVEDEKEITELLRDEKINDLLK